VFSADMIVAGGGGNSASSGHLLARSKFSWQRGFESPSLQQPVVAKRLSPNRVRLPFDGKKRVSLRMRAFYA
jgi:hypothetical protein